MAISIDLQTRQFNDFANEGLFPVNYFIIPITPKSPNSPIYWPRYQTPGPLSRHKERLATSGLAPGLIRQPPRLFNREITMIYSSFGHRQGCKSVLFNKAISGVGACSSAGQSNGLLNKKWVFWESQWFQVTTVISLVFLCPRSWESLGFFRKKWAQRAQKRHSF